ncbi:MAG: Mu-like prophage major head subunit gpT family protein [Pseudobacteriovorax sp.]|nr:Mu-like prophage major head subunit gpT family protein [Pseudobacteriovorax sp.]NRA68627.1 Mu-like prophage major head subunit gpT family protein [Pseudobacteriovorax sp.]
MTLKNNQINTAPVYRAATFLPSSVDINNRTIDVTWTTGARVLRTPWFDDPYFEELAVDEQSVRLQRLNDTGPLLDSHIANRLKDQIGSVSRAWIADGKGYATVQFRSNPESLEIWEDVKDGIIRNISVGYHIHELTETKESDGKYSTYRATDWEPFEISMVSIPADVGAQTRTSNLSTPTNIRSLPEVTTKNKGNPKTQTRSGAGDESPPQPAKCGSEQRGGSENSPNPSESQTEVNINASADSRNQPEPLTNRTFTGSESEKRNSPESQVESKTALNETEIKEAAIKAERERSAAIENLCKQAKLPDMSRSLIDAGVPVEEARKRVFEKMVETEPKTNGQIRVQAGDYDEISVRRGAMASALLHRYAPTKFKIDDQGRKYRGMSLSEMVRYSLGKDAEGLGKRELASRAFHSTSDFPEILANVARTSLLDSYDRLIQNQTWQPLVRITEATDFKPMRKVRLGDIPSLKLVPEGAEIQSGTVSENFEEYRIATYARKFALTRETIINDDLNAFTEMPAKWGIAAARLENILFWSIFTENPQMSDGRRLFSAQHGNLASPGSPISEESLSAAELAMSEQTGLDSRDRLNIMPRYLIVPTTLKTQAKKQVMLPTMPTNVGETNPFMGEFEIISEPLLNNESRTSWYMAADPDQGVDIVEMAYLDGVRSPMVESRESFDRFGTEIRASIDVGAKAIDYRGVYKNEGAPVTEGEES